LLNDWMPAVAALLALVECIIAAMAMTRATAPVLTNVKGLMMSAFLTAHSTYMLGQMVGPILGKMKYSFCNGF